jgi:hypothetical protein
MNLNSRLRAKFVAASIVFVASFSTAAGQTIDVVGDMSLNATSSSVAKANVYRIDASTTLRQQEMRLNFSGARTLTFSVHRSLTEFGVFTRVQTNSVATTGTGLGWYSSGPLSVPMDAGAFYMIGVSWPGSAQYFFDDADLQPVSFGAHVHAHATGLHPLGDSVASPSNDFAIYNQRLTTGVPEPATVALLTLGGVVALLCRRQLQVKDALA